MWGTNNSMLGGVLHSTYVSRLETLVARGPAGMTRHGPIRPSSWAGSTATPPSAGIAQTLLASEQSVMAAAAIATSSDELDGPGAESVCSNVDEWEMGGELSRADVSVAKSAPRARDSASLRLQWQSRCATTDAAWLRVDPSATQQGLFRFWHDEKRFKGTGETSLVQRALLKAGGVRTGGNFKAASSGGPMGYQRSHEWDLLWSPSSTALKAAAGLRAGQLTCSVPGLSCITKKRLLPETLTQAYGSDAFDIIPRTFQLPAQLLQWKDWMEQHPGPAGDPDAWILKTPQHLGKGLEIVPAVAAVGAVMRRARLALKKEDKAVRAFAVAQQYVANPLLIQGRKSGIRLWVVVTSTNPLRAYLHKNGLVLFSNDCYDRGTLSAPDGAPAQGHVTNYAQNTDGGVWNLHQLRTALGDKGFGRLYQRLLKASAHTIAAAMPSMRREAQKLNLRKESAFELLGLDFLVDEAMHPWLLEVNATPSLAAEHADPQVESMIFWEKAGMVDDMLSLLRISERFDPSSEDLLRRARAATAARGADGCGHSEADSSIRSTEAVRELLPASSGSHAPWASSNSSSSGSDLCDHGTHVSCGRQERRRKQRELIQQTLSMHCPEACYDAYRGSMHSMDMLTTLELEMQSRNSFLPLMELFPQEAAAVNDAPGDKLLDGLGHSSPKALSGHNSLRWSADDRLARLWLQARRQLKKDT